MVPSIVKDLTEVDNEVFLFDEIKKNHQESEKNDYSIHWAKEKIVATLYFNFCL
jgi:hypothetical protein